jgi:hypothetical protein
MYDAALCWWCWCQKWPLKMNYTPINRCGDYYFSEAALLFCTKLTVYGHELVLQNNLL